jgi:mycothiol synthase
VLNLTAVPRPTQHVGDQLNELAHRLAALTGDENGAPAANVFEAAIDIVREGGGTELLLDIEPADGQVDQAARKVGFVVARELQQLRRALPLDEPSTLAVRPFVPGRDDWSWLEVNNRAFAWHPEQADWSAADIRTRQNEPWFEPAGFLLHERDGRLAGFCWTKVHDDTEPPLGEIYVVAVDPDFQGLGLGRALVLAGLDSLATRGLTTAMLYVEADNAPAIALYHDLGFELHHTHRWYRLHL